MGVYLDAAAYCNLWSCSYGGGYGDGAHLFVEAIVVTVVNNKVEDVGNRLAARLQGSYVPVGRK